MNAIKLGTIAALTLCLFHSPVQAQSASSAKDPFLWLEAQRDPKAVDWAKGETRKTIERLQAFPSYAQVKQGLETTLKGAPPQPGIVLMGNRALRFLVTEANPFGQLQVAQRDANGVPGAWRTALDLTALRKQSGISYELLAWALDDACLPPEYNRCLLKLSHGGGDETELREFDLDKGEFVKDGFQVPKSLSMAQWLNRDLILVQQTATPGSRHTLNNFPTAVQLWRRGQPLKDAKVIYEARPSDVWIVSTAAGIGPSRYAVIARTIDYWTFELRLVYQDGRIELLPLPAKDLKTSSMTVTLAAGPKALFVQLTRDTQLEGRHYPAHTVLSYAVDPAIPAAQRIAAVYKPGAEDFLDGPFVATRDQVAFVVNRGLVPRVMVGTATNGNWSARPLIQAEAGQAITTLASNDLDNDLIVQTGGFVTPSRQTLYRPGAAPRPLTEDPVLFDGSGYTTEIRSAKSKDGTSIDYYLLKPRNSPWKGAQPLLVTGYAAFGISVVPGYFGHQVGGPPFKLWLDRGGSLVIPAARGGGERGEAWHQAAIRERRQNSYDDFIAVIKQLIDSGYTTPSRIGVFGASNGGLLAAVLSTQHPELFGAVVSDVPLTDLVRLKYMGKGASWVDEYGDAADPKMAAMLAKYSPYQNVRAGVKYPPYFISTSIEDDRTGPGHARKMAAKLASVGTTVYFYEEAEGGHGVSDAYRHAQLMALRMTFLIDSLMKGPR